MKDLMRKRGRIKLNIGMILWMAWMVAEVAGFYQLEPLIVGDPEMTSSVINDS